MGQQDLRRKAELTHVVHRLREHVRAEQLVRIEVVRKGPARLRVSLCREALLERVIHTLYHCRTVK